MLQIPIKSLNSRFQNISVKELINLINNIPVIYNDRENSALKGMRGELLIENIIENFIVEEKNKHAGDFVIWKKDYPNIKIMLEVKNYSSTIPREEFDKFLYDLEYNKFTGGIIITNQPIAGIKPYLIDNNKIYIDSHDPHLINLACETLWAKLFEKMNYKFLDSEGEITIQCGVLSNNLERLATIKSSIDLLQKNNEKHFKKIIDEVNMNIITTRKVINKIISKVSNITTTQEVGKVIELPAGDYFHNIYPEVKEKLEAILLEMNTNCESALLVCMKNKMEVNFCGKKILLEFFKTKVDVKFKPNNYDFTNNKDLSFSEGLIIFSINKSNYLQEFKILQFW